MEMWTVENSNNMFKEGDIKFFDEKDLESRDIEKWLYSDYTGSVVIGYDKQTSEIFILKLEINDKVV